MEGDMSYFPFFVELENRDVLVVGGGGAALHKVRKLLPCGARVTLVARDVCQGLYDLVEASPAADSRIDGTAPEKCVTGRDSGGRLEIIRRDFKASDLENRDFCIAATNDSALNAHIHSICRSHGILMNSVDDKENCDFIFPAVVRRGKLVAGVSTSGAAPRVATLVTGLLEDNIPDNVEEMLDYLEELRTVAKDEIPDDKKRARFLMETAEKIFKSGVISY